MHHFNQLIYNLFNNSQQIISHPMTALVLSYEGWFAKRSPLFFSLIMNSLKF